MPIEGVRQLVGQACRVGSPQLSFKSYPGFDHDPAMARTVPDQLAWIGERFAGTPAGSSCPAP